MPTLAQLRNHAATLGTVCLLVLVAQICAQAQCTFINGNFETGTLSGWTEYHRAAPNPGTTGWFNYAGTATPSSLHIISAPPQGTRGAVSDQNGATTAELYQDFTIPAGQSGTLSFFIAYNNTHFSFITLNTLDYNLNQQARIDLIKTTSANETVAPSDVYTKLFQTKPGDPLSMTQTLMKYDVSGLAGLTIRLRLATAVGMNYFPFAVDDVCFSTTRQTITRTTAASASATTTDFGDVSLRFPTVATAGTTSLTQLDAAAQTGPPAGLSFIGPAYDLSTTAVVTTPIHVCFLLPAITDATTFSHLRMLHKEAGIWVNLPTSSQNFNSKQLCGDVLTLSPFAVGSGSAPTATESSVSGQVTTADGAPLGGVVMQLNGTDSKRTITAADGSYSFSVKTGDFYTVTPARGNYGFSPRERSMTAVGVTNAVFTALPDAAPTVNPLDTNLFFIRQQYLDFLSREPDAGGLDYWASQLDGCAADQACLRQRRIDISAAFFASAEFQESGTFIYGLYDAGLGRRLTFEEFAVDRPKVVGGANLSQNKRSFADQFVARPEFLQRYATNSTAESFVDALLANVHDSTGADLSGQRTSLVSRYLTGASVNESRSRVLSDATEQAQFKQAIYNPSFVLMQYFGYLGRNAEEGGYRFWLDILDTRQPGNSRGMVCSFLTAAEYQQRFSPIVTHANGECGQ